MADGLTCPFVTEDGKQQFKIKISRAIKNGFAGRIEGMDNREEIEALKGTRLYVETSRLPELPDDEFYHSDLIGLEVFDTGGEKLGVVRAVHDHGAGDLLEVFGQGWTSTVLLPFTREAVPTIDMRCFPVFLDNP